MIACGLEEDTWIDEMSWVFLFFPPLGVHTHIAWITYILCLDKALHLARSQTLYFLNGGIVLGQRLSNCGLWYHFHGLQPALKHEWNGME